MKILAQFLQFSAVTLLCGMLLPACNDPEATPEPEPETPGLLTVEGLDDLSDHLQFLNAAKIQGKIPSAPASASSLKFNIKDTLHLIPGVLMPVKFLHDELTNVAGVYIQVHHSSGATNVVIDATHHYDVPEVPNAAESDSISIIIAGFDPDGLVEGVRPAGAPFTFDIIIIPYDSSGLPLDETKVPVIVDDLNDPNSSGSCGLVLPEGEYWRWSMSYVPSNPWDGEFKFFSSPQTIHGGGQDLEGCCIDGVTDHGVGCSQGDSENEVTLSFPTYYQTAYESFVFFDNGTYKRVTQENVANPAPDETDFCNDKKGAIYTSESLINSDGNWTLKNITISPGFLENPLLGSITYTTRDKLTLVNTYSSSSGAFRNVGGIVHQIDCKFGLILIDPDNEGFGEHMYKFYFRTLAGEDEWYTMI